MGSRYIKHKKCSGGYTPPPITIPLIPIKETTSYKQTIKDFILLTHNRTSIINCNL